MTKTKAIRVLIVDDHAVVRSGLHLLLDADAEIEVVGEAGNVKDAVFEARDKKPDVVLMDVVMPGQSGIEGVPLVLKEAPDAKVLVLSMQDDPRYVHEAFAAGASGLRPQGGGRLGGRRRGARGGERRAVRAPRARRPACCGRCRVEGERRSPTLSRSGSAR